MAGFVALHHAMIRAAQRNQPEKVESMLAQGADPLFFDSDKKRAIDRAIEARSIECLKLLAPVSGRAQSPRSKGSLFLDAMRLGWLAGAQALAPFADTQEVDENGYSALMLACSAGSFELAQWALSVCSPGHVAPDGLCALACAVARPGRNATAIAQMLLDAMPGEKKAQRAMVALGVACRSDASELPNRAGNSPDAFVLLLDQVDFAAMGQGPSGDFPPGNWLEKIGGAWRDNSSRIAALISRPGFQTRDRKAQISRLFWRAIGAQRFANADALAQGLDLGEELRQNAPISKLPGLALRLAQAERDAIAHEAFSVEKAPAQACPPESKSGARRL